MAEITVQCQQSFNEYRDGEILTFEEGPFLDKLIAAERVVVLPASTSDDVASIPATTDAPTEARPKPGDPKAAWVAYADTLNLDLAADATKADIIAAVEAAATPTPDQD